MIGFAKTFTGRTLRMAMGALALVGVAAAVPASAHPWRDHGPRYAYGYRHDEGRGWGYGWYRHGPMRWHHERWR